MRILALETNVEKIKNSFASEGEELLMTIHYSRYMFFAVHISTSGRCTCCGDTQCAALRVLARISFLDLRIRGNNIYPICPVTSV